MIAYDNFQIRPNRFYINIARRFYGSLGKPSYIRACLKTIKISKKSVKIKSLRSKMILFSLIFCVYFVFRQAFLDFNVSSTEK